MSSIPINIGTAQRQSASLGKTIQLNPTRRTASDDVFDYLHVNIIAMNIQPGTKMSETEIAKQFGVSRQPVREAFIRLADMRLLEIRPQRATVVRKIHGQEILDARFVRTALEVEVARHACLKYDGRYDDDFAANLALQRDCMERVDFDKFHALDYEFHKLICITAETEFAFRTVVENKSHVDRLCALSLSTREHFKDVIEDHSKIFEFIKQQNEVELVAALRAHLSRLDGTIANVRAAHGEYFED